MNISGPIRTSQGRITMGPMTDEVRDAFARMDRFHQFWDSHYEEIRSQYSDVFVAVIDEKIVAHSNDFWILDEELDHRDGGRSGVQIRFVRVNSPSLVL
jgi:hypothetical protein